MNLRIILLPILLAACSDGNTDKLSTRSNLGKNPASPEAEANAASEKRISKFAVGDSLSAEMQMFQSLALLTIDGKPSNCSGAILDSSHVLIPANCLVSTSGESAPKPKDIKLSMFTASAADIEVAEILRPEGNARPPRTIGFSNLDAVPLPATDLVLLKTKTPIPDARSIRIEGNLRYDYCMSPCGLRVVSTDPAETTAASSMMDLISVNPTAVVAKTQHRSSANCAVRMGSAGFYESSVGWDVATMQIDETKNCGDQPRQVPLFAYLDWFEAAGVKVSTTRPSIDSSPDVEPVPIASASSVANSSIGSPSASPPVEPVFQNLNLQDTTDVVLNGTKRYLGVTANFAKQDGSDLIETFDVSNLMQWSVDNAPGISVTQPTNELPIGFLTISSNAVGTFSLTGTPNIADARFPAGTKVEATFKIESSFPGMEILIKVAAEGDPSVVNRDIYPSVGISAFAKLADDILVDVTDSTSWTAEPAESASIMRNNNGTHLLTIPGGNTSLVSATLTFENLDPNSDSQDPISFKGERRIGFVGLDDVESVSMRLSLLPPVLSVGTPAKLTSEMVFTNGGHSLPLAGVFYSLSHPGPTIETTKPEIRIDEAGFEILKTVLNSAGIQALNTMVTGDWQAITVGHANFLVANNGASDTTTVANSPSPSASASPTSEPTSELRYPTESVAKRGQTFTVSPTLRPSTGVCRIEPPIPALSVDGSTCVLTLTDTSGQSEIDFTVAVVDESTNERLTSGSGKIKIGNVPTLSYPDPVAIVGKNPLSISPALEDNLKPVTTCAILSGSLPPGISLASPSCVVSGSVQTVPDTITVHQLSIVATNEFGDSAPASLSFSVQPPAAVDLNYAPSFVGKVDQELQLLNIKPQIMLPTMESCSFLGTVPHPLSINNRCEVTGKFNSAEPPGTIAVQGRDSEGQKYVGSFQLEIRTNIAQLKVFKRTNGVVTEINSALNLAKGNVVDFEVKAFDDSDQEIPIDSSMLLYVSLSPSLGIEASSLTALEPSNGVEVLAKIFHSLSGNSVDISAIVTEPIVESVTIQSNTSPPSVANVIQIPMYHIIRPKVTLKFSNGEVREATEADGIEFSTDPQLYIFTLDKGLIQTGENIGVKKIEAKYTSGERVVVGSIDVEVIENIKDFAFSGFYTNESGRRTYIDKVFGESLVRVPEGKNLTLYVDTQHIQTYVDADGTIKTRSLKQSVDVPHYASLTLVGGDVRYTLGPATKPTVSDTGDNLNLNFISPYRFESFPGQPVPSSGRRIVSFSKDKFRNARLTIEAVPSTDPPKPTYSQEGVPSGNLVFQVGNPQRASFAPTFPMANPNLTGCSLSPPIEGISIDNQTCVISGQPTRAQAAQAYTVTATNSNGTATTNLMIAIDPRSALLSYQAGSASRTSFLKFGHSESRTISPTVHSDGGDDQISCYPQNITEPINASVLEDCRLQVNSVPAGTRDYEMTVRYFHPRRPVKFDDIGITIVFISYERRAPTISAGTLTGKVGEYFSSRIAFEPGSETATCQITGLPPGLAEVAEECAIIGEPQVPFDGIQGNVSITNSEGLSTSQPLQFSITANTPIVEYVSPFTGTVGDIFGLVPNRLLDRGSPITSCSISPALPDGLTLVTEPSPDQRICSISGDFRGAGGQFTYSIVARNAVGASAAATLVFNIRSRPPSIAYGSNEVLAQVGTPVNLVPNERPSASLFSQPNFGCFVEEGHPLPAGLSLDRTSCVISGTPTSIITAVSFISVRSSEGETRTQLIFYVSNGTPQVTYPPLSSFPADNGEFTINAEVAENGNSQDFCRFASGQTIPLGLTVHPRTCVVTGNANAPLAETTFVVEAGSAPKVSYPTFKLAITSIRPELSYPSTVALFNQRFNVTANLKNFGSRITSCAIDRSISTIPEGINLEVDPTNCNISGLSSFVWRSEGIAIVVTNSHNQSATAYLKLNIQAAPPLIAFSSVAGKVGKPYVNRPSITLNGGIITNCDKEGAGWPAELTVNPSSCALEGTPTQVVSPAVRLSVRATYVRDANANATVDAPLDLVVGASAPIFAYNQTASGEVGTQLVINPSQGPIPQGRPITSCIPIGPSHPSWLAVSSTCVLLGTPPGSLASTPITVRVSDGENFTDASFTISVTSKNPKLAYDQVVLSGVVGRPVASKSPTSLENGGASIVECSSTPPMPAGISLDNRTCSVSGTFATAQAQTGYSIRAKNADGRWSDPATIQLAGLKPANVIVQSGQQVLGLGQGRVECGAGWSPCPADRALSTTLLLYNDGDVTATGLTGFINSTGGAPFNFAGSNVATASGFPGTGNCGDGLLPKTSCTVGLTMAGPAGSRTDGLFNIRFKAVPGDSSLVETIVGLSGQLAKGVYGLEIGGTDPSTGKSRFELYDAFGDVLFTATFNTEGSPAYQQLNGGNRMFGVAVDQTSGCNIRLHRCLVIENNLPFHFVSADECREFNGAIKENDSIGDYGYGCPSELSGTKALKRYKKSVVNRLNQTHTVYYVTTSDSAPAGWVSFPFTRSSAGGPAVPLDVYVAVP